MSRAGTGDRRTGPLDAPGELDPADCCCDGECLGVDEIELDLGSGEQRNRQLAAGV